MQAENSGITYLQNVLFTCCVPGRMIRQTGSYRWVRSSREVLQWNIFTWLKKWRPEAPLHLISSQSLFLNNPYFLTWCEITSAVLITKENSRNYCYLGRKCLSKYLITSEDTSTVFTVAFFALAIFFIYDLATNRLRSVNQAVHATGLISTHQKCVISKALGCSWWCQLQSWD